MSRAAVGAFGFNVEVTLCVPPWRRLLSSLLQAGRQTANITAYPRQHKLVGITGSFPAPGRHGINSVNLVAASNAVATAAVFSIPDAIARPLVGPSALPRRWNTLSSASRNAARIVDITVTGNLVDHTGALVLTGAGAPQQATFTFQDAILVPNVGADETGAEGHQVFIAIRVPGMQRFVFLTTIGPEPGAGWIGTVGSTNNRAPSGWEAFSVWSGSSSGGEAY